MPRVAAQGHLVPDGDLGVFLGGELYITGRIKDLVIIDGRNHYPQGIEAPRPTRRRRCGRIRRRLLGTRRRIARSAARRLGGTGW